MKFTNVLCVTVLAVVATASPWCGHRGQPCKRDPAPLALPEADAWCGHRGQPCRKVKRAAEALAAALAEPVSAPADEYLEARCNAVGGACYNAKRLTRDLVTRVAVAVGTPDDFDYEEEES